jgi:hypothetical protein
MPRFLLQEDETPTVTFPDDYPNSVRHFLLIGFLGMFIGAIVFFYMGISRKVNTVMHVLTFYQRFLDERLEPPRCRIQGYLACVKAPPPPGTP